MKYLIALFLLIPPVAFAQFKPNRATTNTDTEVGQHIGVNVLNVGALGGPNDDTVAINAALAKGGIVVFPPTNYTVGPLQFTNNTTVSGYGARLDFKTNLTASTLFNFASNVNNVTILGLAANGGNTNDCYSTYRATNSLRTFARPWVNNVVTFRDLHISGFDIGVYVQPFTDGQTVQSLPRFMMTDCEFATNGNPVVAVSSGSSVVDEYLNFSGNNMHDNSTVFYVGAGNIAIVNNQLSHNRTAVVVDGSNGINPGHSLIADNIINHQSGDPIIVTNCNLGEVILNNLFFANAGAIRMYASSQVRISGNSFDVGESVIVVSAGTSGANYVTYNGIKGPYGVNATGLLVFDFAVNGPAPTTNLVSFGNYSMDRIGADDPWHWNPYSTNSFVLFNTNTPPTNSLTPGSMYFWNSNAANMYLLKSSSGSRTWASTNLIN